MQVSIQEHRPTRRLRFMSNHKIIEPFYTPIFTTTLVSFQYNNMGLQMKQRLKLYVRKNSQENLKTTGKIKTKALEQFKAPGPTTTINIENSSTPTQINMKPHTKDLFTSNPIILRGMSTSQQKITMNLNFQH